MSGRGHTVGGSRGGGGRTTEHGRRRPRGGNDWWGKVRGRVGDGGGGRWEGVTVEVGNLEERIRSCYAEPLI
ncbi:hypothetical protein CR513_02330, partial [Mucuna pruriens]